MCLYIYNLLFFKLESIILRGQRVYRPVDAGMVAAQGGGAIVSGDLQDDMSFYEVKMICYNSSCYIISFVSLGEGI